MKNLQAFDVRSQLFRQIGILRRQAIDVGRQPGRLQLAHVLVEQRRQALAPFLEGGRYDRFVFIAASGHAIPLAPSRSRSIFTARSHSIRTAPDERSMRRATSSNGSASICRKTMTSR